MLERISSTAYEQQQALNDYYDNFTFYIFVLSVEFSNYLRDPSIIQNSTYFWVY